MKIYFVTGLQSVQRCGVQDYTVELARALNVAGVQAEICTNTDKNTLQAICRNVAAQKECLIHLQYPTLGFGYSVTPHAIALKTGCIVTLHELSNVRVGRQLASFPLTIRARHIFFTSVYEENLAKQVMPWIRGRSSTIPIGSTIPFVDEASGRQQREVVYFGLIAPKKGLEDVIELADIISKNCLPYSVVIIGSIPEKFSDYSKELFRKAAGLPVKWVFDRSSRDVSQMLSRSSLAYLPFPDGASERRGSLKAALGNGVVCITTHGPHTPKALADVTLFAPTPAKAAEMLTALLACDAELDTLRAKGRLYMRQFEWSNIALAHITRYERILTSRK